MTLGRALIAVGAVILAVGVLIQFVPGLRPGRLPGDISFGGANWRVFVPLGTSLLISVVLTLILALVTMASRR